MGNAFTLCVALQTNEYWWKVHVYTSKIYEYIFTQINATIALITF